MEVLTPVVHMDPADRAWIRLNCSPVPREPPAAHYLTRQWTLLKVTTPLHCPSSKLCFSWGTPG